MSESDDDNVSFPEPPSEFQYPRAPIDDETFPDAPPAESHDNDDLAFPDVPTNDLEEFPSAPENLEDLSARLKRLNPSSNFSAAPTRVHVPEDNRTNAEKVNDLLQMYRDEATIDGGDQDEEDEEEAEKKKKTKEKKKHHHNHDSKTQKSMQEYLQAAEQQRGDLNRQNRVADLNPDNIFLAPNRSAAADSVAKEQRAKARYDANQKRHNARIAAQVMRDAKDAGIDPRSIDRSLYENATLDSDLEDDDDEDSDSIELSDSE
jgi:hypothetical protein